MIRPIAVFTTSDIQRYNLHHPPSTLVSTGKLERAIVEGYECYVVSTRTRLSETDTWWRKHVPDDRIFLSSVKEQKEDGGYANSLSTIKPWERLYAVLSITPAPLSCEDRKRAEELGESVHAFACWQDAQDQLESHGIPQGSSF